MKKLFVLFFVMLSATVAAQQGGPWGQNMTVEERAKAITDRLGTVVTLTAEQRTAISAIELDLAKQLEARRSNLQDNREAMREAMLEIERVREEKYKPVLSAEQMRRYIENRDQRQRERGGGGGGPR